MEARLCNFKSEFGEDMAEEGDLHGMLKTHR